MTREVYDWCCDSFYPSKDPRDWFVDAIFCEECRFPLSRIQYYKIKYCPGCGELIEGVVNPNPPINED